MTKKRNSMIKLMTTVLFAIVLFFSMSMPVFAAGDPVVSPDEDNPAEAAITKKLEMPVNTITPEVTFTFTIDKVDVDEDDSVEALATMPDLGATKTLSFNGEAGTESGGIKTVIQETADLFSGVEWPHAGIYTYHITENQTSTLANSFEHQIGYSKAEYDLVVYVVAKDPPNEDELYVYAVSAKRTKTDDNKDGNDEKVDPTPGGGDKYEYSQMIFTNTYLHNNGGTDPNNDDVLAISKTVDGQGGNQSKPFDFSVTVTEPAVGSPAGPYKAYIMEGTTNMTTSANGGTGYTENASAPGNYISFASGSAVTEIKLTHGQKLVFVDLPVGTSFEVTETGTPDYTPKCKLTLNGADMGTTNAVMGNSLSVPASTDTTLYIGEGDSDDNSAAFLNTYKGITPTGLGVDNLPFIVMIIIAAAALTGYVVYKTRRNATRSM